MNFNLKNKSTASSFQITILDITFKIFEILKINAHNYKILQEMLKIDF